MSQENVETIRRALELWVSEGVDAVTQFAHPDGIGYAFKEWPGAHVYRGRDGWRKLLTEWAENFDELVWETERLIDAGDEVVALLRVQAEIKGTGVPIAQQVGCVFGDFRAGALVAEAHFYLTWDEALEAAGLSE